MVTKEKVKMCPFCEGGVPIDATECQYCGSSLIKGPKKARAYQTEDSLASLYEPPYAPSRKTGSPGIPSPDYSLNNYDAYEEDFEEEEAKPEPAPRRIPSKREVEDDEDETTYLSAMLFLSIGGLLFTLAWLLFFFSDHGRLVLEWKSRYWFVYLMISTPLLYKGYQKLQNG